MNPKLLTHPNIPKPLHGMNPRSILGDDWWNEQRQIAYAKENYHCWACGVHKKDAAYHRWLEGHESYDINYKLGSVELKEIVALCHCCHNFIHSGRLWVMYQRGQMSRQKAEYIMKHGISILDKHNLKPSIATKIVSLKIDDTPDLLIPIILEEDGYEIGNKEIAEWSEWHLVLNGKKYYTRFTDMQDWQNFYS